MTILSKIRTSCAKFRNYIQHPREELALWQAKRLAQQSFKKNPVRHFIVPTPEGVLRILTWSEVKEMRGEGFFPRRFKVNDLYQISLWWTAASRKPLHGNSLEKRYVNKDALYKWWYMTHHSHLQ